VTTQLGLILASFALVLLNGFFVAAEFAMVKLRRTRVDALQDIAGWRGAVLARVHANLDSYLSACQLGITLASLGLGWIGEPAFARLVEPFFFWAGLEDPEVIRGTAFFVAFLTISYLHIVVGELAPKSMAIRRPESVSLGTAIPLFLFYWGMYPFIWALNHSAFWLLRKLRLDLTADSEGYDVDEIKRILRSSLPDPAMAEDEWRVLAQALDFDDAEVGDLMRPFSEAVVLARNLPLQDNLARIKTHRFSRYPYVDENGGVIGVVHLKDLFFQLGEVSLRAGSLGSAMKPAFIVDADLPAAILFRRFRLEGHHMAIVGTSRHHPTGIVTFDDMLSALIGGIRDEFRSSKSDWMRLDDGSIVARGSIPIFTLEQTLGIDIEADGVRSVSGMILQKLETLPHQGQRIEFEQFDVVVEKMEGARMTKIHIYPKIAPMHDDPSG
jgi:CBS domain containing-hemolysin-like protein